MESLKLGEARRIQGLVVVHHPQGHITVQGQDAPLKIRKQGVSVPVGNAHVQAVPVKKGPINLQHSRTLVVLNNVKPEEIAALTQKLQLA